MIKREHLEEMNYHVRELVVLEALLRRISLVNMPFILKGSLLTRQYLDNPDVRDVEDIDFLYMGKISDIEHAHETFTNWMIQVTEMDLDDGITFRSFRENAFWRDIDYAMADDFPTVCTDLAYFFTDEPRKVDHYDEVFLDISFNLEMEAEPVSLEYRPVFGDRFIVPYSVPLSIQVAWKLHQTIVRPRFKDLYDLKYLLSHPSYDGDALAETLQTLVNECSLDQSITKADIKKVLVDDLSNLYHSLSNDYYLREYAGSKHHKDYFMTFVTDLRKIMDFAGINKNAYDHLPSPSCKE
ncbi:nucleotidyl transferase AbiEii/AbiGii toxin family protein [Melghirimyces algeriensis]|uniref:Nucleotidyl transferase AbiEii toxin, Type IV TA system n=1 Tax=Melghirimyces algeriensis TaxID=910412 RepID=A0A521FAQ2_9BACL|nr:nucleotidyl transferase AbiEii/AbiGii toxin family protein [Melghirimyces algeriensis]SMO93233.1 Nucleotidyl transferase AbiEii toxin, Type IV TA system [Melghirimyces algeriensis]